MLRAYDLVTRSYFRYILISLGLLLVGYTTYEMTILPLWGYRPMGWMLGLYFISTGLLWRRITKTIAAFRRWLLSVGTGLMLSICFPMSWLLPLVFIALVPLLYIADEEEISFWTLIGHAFGAFYLYNVITTFWVLNTSFAPGIIANGLNAFLMTLPWMLFFVMRRKFARKQAFIGLALFYIAFEYIHLYWEISWPWLNYGNIFANFPDLVQWYEFTGAFGGAYWIWATNLLIFFLLRGYLSGKKWQGILAAVLILPLIASALLIGIRDNVGPEAEVVIIQPNYEPHYEKFDIPSSVQLQHMVQLAQMEVEEGTDFVLFPETVIRRVWLNRIDRHPGVKAFKSLTVDHPNLNVVSGVSSFRSYNPDSLMNPATRVDISARGDTTYWDLQNAALWIAKGEVQEDYFKSKLVPGAEIFPYVELLGFLEPVIDALDGSKEGHFIQESREVFGPDGKKVAPVICYESIYGDYVADYIHEGAQAIFIMTNDGWWDNTPGHRQHLALARLRAIEMRRHIARSANTGISCFIDQKGKVYQASSYDEAVAIKGKIQLNRGITFYAKHGDYLAYIALLVTLLAIVILLRGQVIPEKIQ